MSEKRRPSDVQNEFKTTVARVLMQDAENPLWSWDNVNQTAERIVSGFSNHAFLSNFQRLTTELQARRESGIKEESIDQPIQGNDVVVTIQAAVDVLMTKLATEWIDMDVDVIAYALICAVLEYSSIRDVALAIKLTRVISVSSLTEE